MRSQPLKWIDLNNCSISLFPHCLRNSERCANMDVGTTSFFILSKFREFFFHLDKHVHIIIRSTDFFKIWPSLRLSMEENVLTRLPSGNDRVDPNAV